MTPGTPPVNNQTAPLLDTERPPGYDHFGMKSSDGTRAPRRSQATWRRKYIRVAKLAGTCHICSEPISPGDKIAWAPHREADHWPCFMGEVKRKRGDGDTFFPNRSQFTTGGGSRTSERARQDAEIVRRASERYQHQKAIAAENEATERAQ